MMIFAPIFGVKREEGLKIVTGVRVLSFRNQLPNVDNAEFGNWP